jgi:hypothetical protein
MKRWHGGRSMQRNENGAMGLFSRIAPFASSSIA